MQKILEAIHSEDPEEIEKIIEKILNLLDFIYILTESYKPTIEKGKILKKGYYASKTYLRTNRTVIWVNKVKFEYSANLTIDNICYNEYIYVIDRDLLSGRYCVSKRKIIEDC